MTDRGVGVVFADYSGQVAGPFISMIELAAALGAQHVPVTLVIRKRGMGDSVRRTCPDAQVMEVDLPTRALRRDVVMAQVVARAARKRRVVLHANSTSAARPVLLAALVTRQPVVWHLRNSLLSSRERCLMHTVRRLPRSHVVAVSHVAASVAGIDAAEEATVIADPVSAPMARRTRATLPVRVGVVTNGRPDKGLDILIEIASCLRGHDVVFDIYGLVGFDTGRTPHLAACRQRAEELGVLHMFNDHGLVPSMRDVYQDMHIVLSVTRRESFGRIAVEAMRAGVPVLIPSDAGLLEATGNGRYATVYRLGDPQDAAEKLGSMVASLGALESVAAAGCQWAQRYEPRRVARRMIDVYVRAASS